MSELICIVCPLGCHLTINKDEESYEVKGNTCKRGEKYAIEEITNPKRVVTSTVKLQNSYLHLLPVKTEYTVPKSMIFEIMEELDKIKVNAPIKIGDIIIENVLGTGVNVISTKNIETY